MGYHPVKYYVPDFYHRFLPPFFEKEIPAEVFADCTNCPMTASGREEMESEISRPFSPDSKCCTFIPKLPNYFAGALFSDPEMVTGQEFLRQRIKGKRGIFPQGIFPDKKYRLLYEFGRKYGFGKSTLLRCPYYVQGKYNCALWKYRESICATWFCKYLGGDAGRAFWYQMRDIFKFVQEKLMDHAIRDLGLEVVPPYGTDEQLTVEELDGLPMNQQEFRNRWQHWEGREEEFYIRSAEIISSLKVSGFNRMLGQEYSELLKSLEEKYLQMIVIPEMLSVNPVFSFDEVIPGKYRIKLSSWLDRNDTAITWAFDLPKPVIDAFRKGKTSELVLLELSEEKGILLGKDLVIALYHHGVLTPGEKL